MHHKVAYTRTGIVPGQIKRRQKGIAARKEVDTPARIVVAELVRAQQLAGNNAARKPAGIEADKRKYIEQLRVERLVEELQIEHTAEYRLVDTAADTL